MKPNCMVELPSGNIVDGWHPNDGLIYILPDEAARDLTTYYPHWDRGGWYFNATKDRYVAERTPYGISVNPQFIIKHCSVVTL